MKKIFPIFFLLAALNIHAQNDTVLSDVYKWENLKFKNAQAEILEGSTTDLKSLIVYTSILKPGKSFKEKSEKETLIIIKNGEIKISVNDSSKNIGKGSIALIVPGDEFQIENSGKDKASFYRFVYESRSSVEVERAKKAGGSFVIDWNDLIFKPHGKGGIREYFEKPTSMFKRFEMHVTTLNAGIKSHEPHTHRAEEVVLMIDGNGEMQIGEDLKKVSKNDLIFLGANVPHAIKNIGNNSCTYFAFQWE